GRTMEAQFVREIDGDATFLKDGKLITIPLDRLTEKDQKLIRDIEAGKKIQPDQPPAGATSRDNGVPPDDSPAENGGDRSRPNLTNQKVVADNRDWRDTNGWQVTAKFVRYHEGNVILNRLGRVVSMPFDSLSPDDQRYVRKLLTAKGEAAQLPPPTPAELG